MSIIAKIGTIPLFSTYQEAKVYGKLYGLKGFHTHVHSGSVGFMAGNHHEQAVAVKSGESIPSTIAPANISVPPPDDFTDINIAGGSSVADILPSGGGGYSGGGGGGGY